VADSQYRSEIEAAHARIRQLEEELARHREEPAARLADLIRERAMLAQQAAPTLTTRELSIHNAVLLVFATAAVCFVTLMFWWWALLAAIVAVAVRVFLARTARRRAAGYARQVAAIDAQIASVQRALGTESSTLDHGAA
jgi:hypothetical protein